MMININMALTGLNLNNYFSCVWQGMLFISILFMFAFFANSQAEGLKIILNRSKTQ